MLAVVVPAVIVVAVGAALLPTLVLHRGGAAPSPIPSASSAGQEESNSLPAYMLAAGSEVQQAYRYAAEQPAALEHIPCYCGCGGHSGHRSVRDCFLSEVSRDAVKFEEHGSTCGVCVGIVRDVQEQLAQGKSLPAVRAYIDAKWGEVGPGTDTPLPPE
ncbi:MAG: hypothetical protein A2Z17_04680 [Gammaproteobacteria bacterium RBG_16_66_13]|nr:MAG: hypothetical protein A2Z17_04680 [Gammaproteobacteria bacterium RBG_16_66_13]